MSLLARPKHVRPGLAVLMSALVMTALFHAVGAPRAAAAARPTGPLSPASGALFGAHVAPTNGDWSQASVKATVTARETDLGRKLGVNNHTYGWGNYFPTWAETWDFQNGRIPMITWSAGDAGDIAAGKHDAMIATRGDAVKALPGKVFIRLFPQMDLQTGLGTPAEFVAAYRKVRNIFNSRGATNAVFVWAPSASSFGAGKASSYYPGDAYVHWIGAEGYNWAPGQPGATWTSFYNIFKGFYDWASLKGKPLMVGGTGVQEHNTGHNAWWIDSMAYSLKNSYPFIQAIVYTDAKQAYDWRPDTSSGSYTAYKRMAADAYFKPGSSTSTQPNPLNNAGTLLGAYVKPATGWNTWDFQNAVTDLETRMGSKLDVGHQYIGWKENLGGWVSKWHMDKGRIPMVSWHSAVVTEINAGLHDAWIRQQADAVKALSKPVMIRYLWEMDITTDLSVGSSEFIAAWRRIVGIFDSRGATNARWVWCPTAHGFATGEAAKWYPGDAYVDWIGADGYNWGDATTQSKWRSFKDVFASFYSWGAAKNKPLLIGETGTQEGLSGQKKQWILDMGTTIKTNYPRIKALVYFDADASSYSGGWYDWRLDTSWGSFDAWKTLGNDPYFTSSHNI